MNFRRNTSVWWGPPRKFDPRLGERKISWLELFYDLVYVIAISRITHRLSNDLQPAAFLEYGIVFLLIFWGWLNGSLYHDLHGNSGLRTRLMTLWQMMIIALLAITIDLDENPLAPSTTITFMAMQLFITYQWWSVGIYDKAHRRYNKPYTIFFLISLGLMGLNLVVPPAVFVCLMPLILLLNYTPPFIANRLLRRSSLELSLSSSMTERLGLFTIIVFGEVVLGVVNGVSKAHQLAFNTLLGFAMAISLVFTLWWLFFTLISNREASKGFTNATLIELLYLPTLLSLGLIAASFSAMFIDHTSRTPQQLFAIALAVFPACISFMMRLLRYPGPFSKIKVRVRRSLLVTSIVLAATACFAGQLSPMGYFGLALLILLCEIYYLNALYYSLNIEQTMPADDAGE